MGKHCDRMIHVTACLSILFAILGGTSYLILRGMREQVLINLDEYSEIKTEWDTIPFIDVTLMPKDVNCPVHFPALVAWDNWPGLDVMCYCNSEANYGSVVGEPCTGSRADSTRCSTREAVPTLYLGVLDGYKICGRRGGKKFS